MYLPSCWSKAVCSFFFFNRTQHEKHHTLFVHSVTFSFIMDKKSSIKFQLTENQIWCLSCQVVCQSLMSNFMCGAIFDLKDVLGERYSFLGNYCFKSNYTKFYILSYSMCCLFQCFKSWSRNVCMNRLKPYSQWSNIHLKMKHGTGWEIYEP